MNRTLAVTAAETVAVSTSIAALCTDEGRRKENDCNGSDAHDDACGLDGAQAELCLLLEYFELNEDTKIPRAFRFIIQ
jgi:hypothetical protein